MQQAHSLFRKSLSCVLTLVALCAPLSRHVHATPDAPFALVKDITAAPSPIGGMNDASLFAPLGETILFSAHTPQTGFELWRTHGSEAGTTLRQDIVPRVDSGNPQTFIETARFVEFTVDVPGIGRELWATALEGQPPLLTPVPTPPGAHKVHLPVVH